MGIYKALWLWPCHLALDLRMRKQLEYIQFPNHPFISL